MKKIAVTYKQPGGIIWKILPNQSGEYLVIESRDAERRKTLLSCLRLVDDSFLYTLDALPKPWWIGLKALEEHKLILQGYKESNSPEPKGFYVFDLIEGNLLHTDEEGIYEAVVKPASDIHSIFPVLYEEDNPYYKTIANFLNENNHYTCVGTLEYLEFGPFVLISFYIRENEKLTNILLVLNEEGEELLSDKLIEGSTGVGLATFFICNQKLIYIKNKTSIALAQLL